MDEKALESDRNLVAAGLLLGLDVEALEERAGILQYDAGIPRDVANKEALVIAMKERDRRYSRAFILDYFKWAGIALEAETRAGKTRSQTIAWVLARLAEVGDGE